MQFMKKMMRLMPDTWTEEFVYKDKRFILVDVEEGCEEYQDVVKQFTEYCKRVTIFEGEDLTTKQFIVQRVQHPYAYARYQLHKEAVIGNERTFTEDITYVRVSEDDLTKYLDYACDERRMSHSLGDNILYVQRQVINDNYFNKRDSNTFPKYVIKLKPIQTVETDLKQPELEDSEETDEEKPKQTEEKDLDQIEQERKKRKLDVTLDDSDYSDI